MTSTARFQIVPHAWVGPIRISGPTTQAAAALLELGSVTARQEVEATGGADFADGSRVTLAASDGCVDAVEVWAPAPETGREQVVAKFNDVDLFAVGFDELRTRLPTLEFVHRLGGSMLVSLGFDIGVMRGAQRSKVASVTAGCLGYYADLRA